MSKLLLFLLVSLTGLQSAEARQVQKLNTNWQDSSQIMNLELARKSMLQFEQFTMVPHKKNALMNAAVYYGKAGYRDSALVLTELAVTQYGFGNLGYLLSDSLFLSYQKDKRYKAIVKQMIRHQKSFADPEKAKIITSDIPLFWQVYDRYLQDTTGATNLFIKEYFEKGSVALQDYYRLKTPNIGGIRGFVKNMSTMRKFYAGIRANTLQVVTLEDTIRQIYRNLKSWYPQAIFPPATLLIGGWSSGGTATDYGQILGVDMQSIDENTDLSELNAWQKRNVVPTASIKYILAHELVHVQQGKMREDTILLFHAIKEGMADFIGELISGRTGNETNMVWAKGKERKIWDRFAKEMYLNRYSNWIANSNQETPDNPADLGYWVGYQICKSYFEKAIDKKQAVYNMLHLRDYSAFLKESGFEASLKQ